jgi:glycosyltransferase involved in cell wall biosynthesis
MKVLFIGSDPSLFDTSSASYARMLSYAEAIGDLTILMRSNGPSSEQVHEPLTIVSVQGGKLDGLRKVQEKAREIITTKGIEVVSAQDPFEHGFVAMQAVKGTTAKLHIQVHTDFLSPWFVRSGVLRSPMVLMPAKNRVRLTLADKVLPKANGIRCVSERIKQSLIKQYGSTIPEPSVIPIAVSTDVPPAVPLPTHQFTFALITVGRLEPEKRIEDIIEALSLIHNQYPAVGLIIVGSGREEATLKKLVVKKGLAEKVVFTGPRTDAWGLMRSAQCYIQASAYEGYGRTLVEAALSRIPIITSDVGVVGEIFKGYEDVLASPPGDPTNLAYQIIKLVEDPVAKERMIRSAEVKAKEHLSTYADLPHMIAADLARLQAPATL